MVCPACNASIPENLKFCPKCGNKVAQACKATLSPDSLICPRCQAAYPPNVKFCKADGTPLQSAVPSMTGRADCSSEESATPPVFTPPVYPPPHVSRPPDEQSSISKREDESLVKDREKSSSSKKYVFVALLIFLLAGVGAIGYYFLNKKPAEIASVVAEAPTSKPVEPAAKAPAAELPKVQADGVSPAQTVSPQEKVAAPNASKNEAKPAITVKKDPVVKDPERVAKQPPQLEQPQAAAPAPVESLSDKVDKINDALLKAGFGGKSSIEG